MKKEDLKQFVEKFGMIRAGELGYKKTLHGTIKEMDSRGNIWFVDNDGYGLVFKSDEVDTFEAKEFTSLSDKYKGKDIYWKGGRIYYANGKECELNK